jgi:hypothetical protein
VTSTAELGGAPRAVAVAGNTVWAAVAPGGERPLPAETGSPASRVNISCGPTLFGGEGEPDALIVSDLPLQGGVRLSAQQMVQAIAFVVRRHGFRAGELRLGYQSCDDSVGRTGLFDEDKCAANARAYLRDPRVLGIVGTLNSPCTVAALPVLNGGPEPAPAMVSPLNSYVGLTRPAPGAPPRELDSLYPGGGCTRSTTATFSTVGCSPIGLRARRARVASLSWGEANGIPARRGMKGSPPWWPRRVPTQSSSAAP